MTADPVRSRSLFRWLLESPRERLFKGLVLPLALLTAFIGMLLVDLRAESDEVYYNPGTNEVRAAEGELPEGFQRRVKITYWEKWSGFEGEAIKAAVDHFNRTNKKAIYVDLTLQGDITQKIRTATSGGNPPDLAGLYSVDVPVFAAQNALLPLDERMAKAKPRIGRETYVPVYYDLCVYRGKTWALPTTPSTWALHWNKKLFREAKDELQAAGLDHRRAPQTIAELDKYADILTQWEPKKPVRGEGESDADHQDRIAAWKKKRTLTQIGFLQTEPGWWKYSWGLWFGGTLWNGRDRITADCAGNLAAMKWVRTYVDTYGYEKMDAFKKTFGDFSTSDNAFFTGKVAMEIQGVWMARFVEKYAPKDFEYGVDPFPARQAGLHSPAKGITVAEADVIGIPRGAKHPKEAFEFIRFMARPEGMHILCKGHGKHSPLAASKNVDGWIKNHPNKYVGVFTALSDSPNCHKTPPLGVWNEYRVEFGRAFDDVWARKKTPQQALADLQKLMQRRFEHELSRQRALGIRIGGDR